MVALAERPPEISPVSSPAAGAALNVRAIDHGFVLHDEFLPVLQDVSFRVRRGEAYGLVGESGCGKSTVAMAALRYLPRNGKVKAGKIIIAGQDVQKLDAHALRSMRANA